MSPSTMSTAQTARMALQLPPWCGHMLMRVPNYLRMKATARLLALCRAGRRSIAIAPLHAREGPANWTLVQHNIKRGERAQRPAHHSCPLTGATRYDACLLKPLFSITLLRSRFPRIAKRPRPSRHSMVKRRDLVGWHAEHCLEGFSAGPTCAASLVVPWHKDTMGHPTRTQAETR